MTEREGLGVKARIERLRARNRQLRRRRHAREAAQSLSGFLVRGPLLSLISTPYAAYWLFPLLSALWWKLLLIAFWSWAWVDVVRSTVRRLRQGRAVVPLPPELAVERRTAMAHPVSVPHPASRVGALDAWAWIAIVGAVALTGAALARALAGDWIVLDPVIVVTLIVLAAVVRRRTLRSRTRSSQTHGQLSADAHSRP